jgi:hypothetical protein
MVLSHIFKIGPHLKLLLEMILHVSIKMCSRVFRGLASPLLVTIIL